MSRSLKLIGAFAFAALLVAAESMVSTTTRFGSVIPIQAHVFVLAFILLYLVFSVGEIRDRLDTLITLQRGAVATLHASPDDLD